MSTIPQALSYTPPPGPPPGPQNFGPQNFGQLLKGQRTYLGLSLQEAADRLKLSKPHLWDMEQGNSTNPRADTLMAINRHYGLGYEQLFKSLQTQPTVSTGDPQEANP